VCPSGASFAFTRTLDGAIGLDRLRGRAAPGRASQHGSPHLHGVRERCSAALSLGDFDRQLFSYYIASLRDEGARLSSEERLVLERASLLCKA